MTVKQGEDINKQFTSLNDSLSKLNDSLSKARVDINRLIVRNTQLSRSLNKSMDEVVVIGKQAGLYKSSYEHAEYDLKTLRRDHKNITVGLLVLLGLWTAYTSVMINQ